MDGAGKSETVNLLNAWMDPRWIVTQAFGDPSDEERERPEYWRFWRALPPRGRIGLFLSSWYSRPILDRVYRRLSGDGFAERLRRIVDFEQTLAADGALILKFWMHLGKAAQKKRLTNLERDPLRRWHVDALAWKHWRMYSKFAAAGENAIRLTNRGDAPWTIVEGEDARYRSLAVGEAVRDAIRAALADGAQEKAAAPARKPAAGRKPLAGSRVSILSSLDMEKKASKKVDEEIEKQQGRLNLLERKARAAGVSSILVFEGWDAAGKGGAIRRVTAALDARDYRVIPIAAPTDEERAQHYLWRFWRHLGRAGRVTIFDRSWYGRVLVERVEGFATEKEWMRAYAEINQFEDQLADHGIVLAEVLAARHQGRAVAPVQGARGDASQAVEADARGLAEPRPVAGVRGRGERHDRADQHAPRAVDARRGERQGPRPPQGAEDDVRPPREAARQTTAGKGRGMKSSECGVRWRRRLRAAMCGGDRLRGGGRAGWRSARAAERKRRT